MKKSIIIMMVCLAGSLQAAKEIELKMRLDVKRYFMLEQWLHAHGNYKGETEQTEYYLVNPDELVWDYSAGFKDTLKTLRVRTEKKGDSVCYKYAHIDPATNKSTHRDEYETKVSDGTAMLEILTNLGYTQQTRVVKKRMTYMVDDMFEIVLDDVQGLGCFVEIELKESVESVKLGVEKIENLLRTIGIDEFVQYGRGYIHMIWNPGYDFGMVRKLQ